MVSIIAAVSNNYVLGKENKLLWHLPKDFKFFKEKTIGKPMIMGRKTFESLPGFLPDRTHIVITRDCDYKSGDAIIVESLERAIEIGLSKNPEVSIIGGGQIFKEALDKDLVDKIYLTEIDTEIDGDAFFPTFDKSQWEITKKECHPKDERHSFDFCFVEYLRK